MQHTFTHSPRMNIMHHGGGKVQLIQSNVKIC